MQQDKIRNFSIIAHIDHGKSTLADRMLELTGVLSQREMEAQVLDNMDIERERGITIKAQAVRMLYKAKDGETYELNLIDTPGHVDFNYEVSRSLAACEGAILVVDASQGVEAQTLANTYLALENDLEILPVINKVDLPNARPDEIAKEIEDVIGLEAMDSPRISAKSGLNVEAVLEEIVNKVPAPTGEVNKPLKALIFDSFYDNYKGAISYVRLMEGKVKAGDNILMMSSGKIFTVTEVGYFRPGTLISAGELKTGEVGYIAASIKNVADTRVGDTITNAQNPTAEPLPGYKKANPMVFCGIYPVDGADYENLKAALDNGLRGQTPYTPAVGILLQIHARLLDIKEKGGVYQEIAKKYENGEEWLDAALGELPNPVLSRIIRRKCEEIIKNNKQASNFQILWINYPRS